MPYKKKSLPLHVSRALILREQADVIRRTQRRIEQLRATENSKNNDEEQDPVTITVHVHSPSISWLSNICFCVWLVCLNLLFLQWLYYDVRKST
jgi:hypothetical protein